MGNLDQFLVGIYSLTAEEQAKSTSKRTDLNKDYLETYKLLEGVRKSNEQASSTSMGDFVDNEDGTVTDQRTGLLWQRAEDGTERNYEEALTYCQSLSLAGHHDWRLPRKEELAKLATVDFEALREVFPNIKKERYWARTMVDELHWAEAPERIAYTIDFAPDSGNYGHPITNFRTYRYYVRAVT